MKKLSDCRVLLVDDTKANLDILVEGLKSDHKLSLALNGEMALQIAARTPPDPVLLEVPEVKGRVGYARAVLRLGAFHRRLSATTAKVGARARSQCCWAIPDCGRDSAPTRAGTALPRTPPVRRPAMSWSSPTKPCWQHSSAESFR